MNRLNASIAHIPLPKRLRWAPISETGYPVPWFVDWIDGKPDFRVMDGRKYDRAIKHDLCWLCGQTLGRFKVFTAGPMCAVNRTSGEPPSTGIAPSTPCRLARSSRARACAGTTRTCQKITFTPAASC